MANADKRQCWAYNKDGQRCENQAGHEGNHSLATTWSDEECYSPIKHQLPTPVVTTTPIPDIATIPVPKPASTRCVACDHSHKGSECRCGCYEFIG